MKKISLCLLVVLFLSTVIYGEEWISFDNKGEASPDYEIFQSNSSSVEFGIEVPGMNSKDVEIYNRIYIPEHTKMDSTGFPEVPVVSYLIAIPVCDNVNLNITLLDSTIIDNMNIYPAPELIEQNSGDIVYMEEQFTIDNTFYNTDTYFPDYAGELVEKGAVREQHCIRVKVYPVKFNPVQQQVIAYSRFNIEITFDNASGSVNNDVGIFNEVCGNAMINYNSNGLSASVSCGAGNRDPGDVYWVENFPGEYVNENCDYLIITHQDFWENPDLQNLADRRADYNGFDVCIVKMNDIENQIYSLNNLNSERIRNLIQNTYENENAENTFDGKLGYVLLFGDNKFYDENGIIIGECVPTHYANPLDPDPEDGGYDVYFSQLTEISGFPDVYPEILIGRCPVDDAEQVANVCRKTINYEPIPADSTWKDRMTFLAAEIYDSTTNGLEIIAPLIEDYETTVLSDGQHTFPGFDNYEYYSEDELKTQYENGNLIITYMGHGGNYHWSWPELPSFPYNFYYEDIDKEEYNNKLPLIFSMACVTGAFQFVDDCMAEKFLVSDSIRGSIGFIGSSVNTDGGCFNKFAPHLFKAPFEYDLGMCGEILLEGKLNTSKESYRNCFNLFGDPALNILLDSETVTQGDLLCNQQQIIINSINNQNLEIISGISNRSEVNITDNFDVICYLINPFYGTTNSISQTINGINAMETISANFSFTISDCMPTEFEIQIIVDPDSLIPERNEKNNDAEIVYDYYRYQDGFPVLLNDEDFIVSDIPLYNSNNIIIGGKKISPSGDILWDSNIRTCGLSLPSKNETSENTDYIIRNLNRNKLYKINGLTGDSIWVYNSPTSYCIFNYCLGDINNDGINEIVATSFIGGLSPNQKITILDLNGNIMLDESLSNKMLTDLAVGDGDGDGKAEIYVISSYLSYKIICYEYNNGQLVEVDQEDFVEKPLQLSLLDFDNTGVLDCIIITKGLTTGFKIYFLDCVNLNNLFSPITLSHSLCAFALGDIYNDETLELMTLENDGSVHTINSSGTYEFLFYLENDYRGFYDGLRLYDLDSDNELDIVLHDSNNILGYTLDGELRFAFPDNEDKTFPLIYDIDDDNDIEMIFGKNKYIDNWNNYSIVIASDLNIDTSHHSNIYPNMNEWNNNLYSQPVTGNLNEETTYYWNGTITLHQDVILPETSELYILPGTVIKARENSKLIVYGNIIAEGTEDNPIIFKPDIYGAPSYYWQGIGLSGSSQATITHCQIENAKTGIYAYGGITALIDSNLISDCVTGILIETGGNYIISHNEFVNSLLSAIQVSGSLFSLLNESIEISNNLISGLSDFSDNGIYLVGCYRNVELFDNCITGNDNGISAEKCGKIHINRNNINYNVVGINLIDSYPGMKENTITDNENIGIFISGDSYPVIELCNLIANNGDYEIYMIWGDPIMQNGHNDIVNDYGSYLLYKHEEMPPGGPLHVEYNWWGQYPPNEEQFYPLEYFQYMPADENSNTGYDNDDEFTPEGSKIAFNNAYDLEDEGQYSDAKLAYKDIIITYPDTKEAKASLRRIFSCENNLDLPDFGELSSYYDSLSSVPDTLFAILSRNLSIECKTRQEIYDVALNDYDTILMSYPILSDSVFTVINIMSTLMLADTCGGKGLLNVPSKILEMKPKDMLEYSLKKKELLRKIGYPLSKDPENIPELPDVVYLNQNYPNPMRSSTTISFSLLPNTQKAELKIYNIKGQLVRELGIDNKSGIGSITWDGLDSYGKKVGSGIYFYKLSADKKEIIKKMVLMR